MTIPDDLMRLFGVEGTVPNFPPRYNVAPSQAVPVVRQGARGRELTLLNWGLIPSWAKQDSNVFAKPLINARSESITEKPSFRNAFRRRRCLMPADGFYEWQRPDSGPTQPFNIARTDGSVFAMAAVWELWSGADGSEIESCAIITTEANATLAPIHHRMPVILDPADWTRWLDAPEQEAEQLLPILRPAPDDLMEAWPVSVKVNRVANDGPELLERAEPLATEPQSRDGGHREPPKQGNLFD